ncbi:MAG: hypothetical protein WAU39_17365 [Polyangiales bacterium]
MPRVASSWSAWASALAFFLTGLFPLFNADAYGHLAQGRQIAALGAVPKVDLFSFWKPEPQPWRNYEWAYDLVTWLVYDHWGASALVLVKCLALSALGYLLVVLGRQLSEGAEAAGPITLAALLLVLPVARFRFTTRPQIIGLLFPVILLLGLSTLFSDRASTRRKSWTLGGLALLQFVWVNAHGSHLFGLALSAIFAVFSIRAAAFRWMLGLLALQVATTACTPFGIAIVTDALSHVLDPRYRELVVEWGPWSAQDPLRLLVAPVVMALLVVVSMRPVTRSSRFGVAYAVFCVLVSLMAFRSMRFVAHQLLFCAPLVAAGLCRMPRLRMDRRGVALVAVAGAAAVSAAWMARLVPALGFGAGEDKQGYPWASAELIERKVEHPRILASIEDSWFLMFAAPSARLLIDGRVPFYGPEMIREVGQSFADPRLLAAELVKHEVNTVVIDNTRSDHVAAAEHLVHRSDWALGFVEDGHSLFVRRDASPTLEPFVIAGPGYRTGRLLDPRIPDSEVEREVGRLGSQLNTAAIHAWHQGLELLRPLARDGGRAGIRMYRSASEQERARAAYRLISIPAHRYPGFTTIELYEAMAALAACDVAVARRAVGRAMYGGQTRETSLVLLEISLRAGGEQERRAAVAQLKRLRMHPESRDDPWVAAIARDLALRCPSS